MSSRLSAAASARKRKNNAMYCRAYYMRAKLKRRDGEETAARARWHPLEEYPAAPAEKSDYQIGIEKAERSRERRKLRDSRYYQKHRAAKTEYGI